MRHSSRTTATAGAEHKMMGCAEVNFTAEWELKAYILRDKPEPRPRVNVILCLLNAVQAAGRWTLEFVDQAFANDFFNSQSLFESMPKPIRRRFLVSVMLRHTPEKEVESRRTPFQVGRRYRLDNLYGLEISHVGGIYGFISHCPSLVAFVRPDTPFY